MMNLVKENALFNEMLNYCKCHESREKALEAEIIKRMEGNENVEH